MGVRWIRPSLLSQMIGLISIVIFITLLFESIIFSTMIEDIKKTELSNQAMAVAKLAAQNERIIQAFKEAEPSQSIQPIAEEIRKITNAGYVVIGNTENIRYSHHVKENIGKIMGTSNEEVFEGKSITYEDVGISGSAIKAKTPIYNEHGEIIGVSSVGYLTESVNKKINDYQARLFKMSMLILFIGIVGATIIAKRVKRKIFNLEPEEIAFLFKEKEATVDAIRDAIIAVNKHGEITSINKRAREILKDNGVVENNKIFEEKLHSLIKSVIQTKQSKINIKLLFGHQLYIVDAAPIVIKDQTSGVVLTIRPESELEQIADEVSKIKTISDNIRAQNHEYLNKLNTIYGLVALKQYDEVKEFIYSEVKERQDTVVFLTSSLKDPFIAACLLGKINQSKELKVQLKIDEESNLTHIPSSLNTKLLVTVISNIIDNAMEAAICHRGEQAQVNISFTDLGSDIVFDIEDNGMGVPLEMEKEIFTEGFTTKQGENHGLGLAIVKNTLDLLNGELYVTASELGGACFTVVLKKEQYKGE